MNNLFSSFDPASYMCLPLNWVSGALVLFFLPPTFWLTKNQTFLFLKKIIFQIKAEFEASMAPFSVPGVLLISLSLFLYIVLNNFLGLSPFTFTASSHLTFTLTLALPLWLGHMVLASLKTPNSVMAHLVPLGTPLALVPFMVLVELVSSIIRPVTLSVRLAANMTAGHLLLALLGSQGYGKSLLIFMTLITGMILLMILETAVSLIQAYVFSVLSTLYFNEVNSPNLN